MPVSMEPWSSRVTANASRSGSPADGSASLSRPERIRPRHRGMMSKEEVVAISSPRDTLFHTSVLLDEALEFLAVQPGGRYIDCTLGAGGHALAIMRETEPGGLLLGL